MCVNVLLSVITPYHAPFSSVAPLMNGMFSLGIGRVPVRGFCPKHTTPIFVCICGYLCVLHVR